MLILVALSTGIICLNAVFQFEGLRVATDGSYASAFGAAGSNAPVLLLLDIQHYGTLIAQVFFGLWLVPLGYLAYKSARWFPKWLGVVLIVGGVCYLVDLLAAFLLPGFGQMIHGFVLIPSAIAEILMVLYLLVIGVKTAKPGEFPRDMLKLGRLVLNGGVWHGRQVVSRDWIDASLKDAVWTGHKILAGTDGELTYGYFWWSGHVAAKERSFRWAAAFGNGGQRIYVVPALDLSVVITAGSYGSDAVIPMVQALFQRIVATVRQITYPHE